MSESNRLNSESVSSNAPPLVEFMIGRLIEGSIEEQHTSQLFFLARGEKWALWLRPYLSDRSLTPRQLGRVVGAMRLSRVTAQDRLRSVRAERSGDDDCFSERHPRDPLRRAV